MAQAGTPNILVIWGDDIGIIRADEAGADMEPDRPPSGPGRRELERRRAHAPLRAVGPPTLAAPPPAARRRRERVRLHTGAEEALANADAAAWTVIGMKHDWSTVFDS
jgi:hypothetical protein